jgi:hypothetical protein
MNYAVKSSLLLSFLESVPEVDAKLKARQVARAVVRDERRWRSSAKCAATFPMSSTAWSFSRRVSLPQRRNCSRRAPLQVQESQEWFVLLRAMFSVLSVSESLSDF